MTTLTASSDADLLELLRRRGRLSVAELASAMEVTATAVRQRLTRLLARGLIEREAVRGSRGRPRHNYRLTNKGVRVTGSNLPDLALALWRELGAVEDPEIRWDLLRRIARTLASGYARHVEGATVAERMRSLAGLLADRQVPFSVEGNGSDGLPVLTAHACPYPDLAEEDPSICAMERMLFSELLKHDLKLSRSEENGCSACQFRPAL